MPHVSKTRATGMRHLLPLSALLLVLMIVGIPLAYSQGCAQCRDNAAATPPQTQAAYRHAIVLLGGAAALLFAGTLILIKRNR